MGKFSIELRGEASRYVDEEAEKRYTSRAEIVRKALNVLATLGDRDVDVILQDRKTGVKTRLLID